MTRDVARLARSELVESRSLGTTRGGREIWLLTVSTGKHEAKPAILVLGSVHAPHLAGSEFALRIVRKITENRDKHRYRKLLESCTLYVIPRPSPDASEAFFTDACYERTVNLRPTDDDRDGDVNEDPPDDLNGDGLITMMRVEDPAGTHMPHPDDRRVLIEADVKRNERGRYLLYREGIDNDGDGQWNEDGAGGVDFNRNFTFEYPYFEPGAGPHQVSEPETRAVADFAFERPNIWAVFSFAPQDTLVHAWKPSGGSEGSRYKTAIRNADAPYADFLAKRYRKLVDEKGAPAAGREEGSLVHWAYFHYGRWSFATRGWWPPEVSAERLEKIRKQRATEGRHPLPPEPPLAEPSEKRGAAQLNDLRWLETEGISGFVPWTPVAHPDFPGRRVEVGGFQPYVQLNPPAALLDGVATKHAEFLAELADHMPVPRIAGLEAKPLGAGLFRVTATAVNRGYLPTASLMGKESNRLHPLQMELVLPEGVELIQGVRRPSLDPISLDEKEERTWLVRREEANKKEIEVRLWSPSVGSDRREGTLE